jgi:hypothetical protein
MAIYSGFTHETWWFSIVMLVYQRVYKTVSAKKIGLEFSSENWIQPANIQDGDPFLAKLA